MRRLDSLDRITIPFNHLTVFAGCRICAGAERRAVSEPCRRRKSLQGRLEADAVSGPLTTDFDDDFD